jgi:subtilisin family serine protease
MIARLHGVQDPPIAEDREIAWLRNHARALGWPLALIGACLIATPASAQLLHGLGGAIGGLPSTLGGTLNDVRRGADLTVDDLSSTTTQISRDRLGDLARSNPRALEFDDRGAVVVRGAVLAVSPSPASLGIAAKAGFSVLRETRLEALGLDLITLGTPKGMSAREALRRLRTLDPDGRYDLDHLYADAGEVTGATSVEASGAAPGLGARIGLLDTGIDRRHPAFAASVIEQHGFAPGGVTPAAHGTAVASLMVGEARGFHGSAPGASLFAADVYGAGPTGGSADAIVQGLAWMAENHVRVINISLVGPPNLTLEMAVRALVERGVLIVAPVGNDGPAAPPLYPAAYPGVVAVTGVDKHGKALIEAGRAGHIDFAAPGADLEAAKAGGGYARVRGTSFAAPIVAGRLADMMHGEDRASAARALAALTDEAHKSGGVVGRDIALADQAR